MTIVSNKAADLVQKLENGDYGYVIRELDQCGGLEAAAITARMILLLQNEDDVSTDLSLFSTRLDVEISQQTDVLIRNHGTIVVFVPQTALAKSWVQKNMADIPDYMRVGTGFACEHGCARPIFEGMTNDGLNCQPQ